MLQCHIKVQRPLICAAIRRWGRWKKRSEMSIAREERFHVNPLVRVVHAAATGVKSACAAGVHALFHGHQRSDASADAVRWARSDNPLAPRRHGDRPRILNARRERTLRRELRDLVI